MDTAEILKRVRKIEIKTKALSKHLSTGDYNSAFKGKGMSFSEVRAYQYGDDVRDIDWNVTARSGDTHIKVYEEEREMTMMMLVDLSASTALGTRSKSKLELIVEVVAVLAFSAMSNNDKVGAILFTDRIERYIPPKKGRKNILRIIRDIIVHETQSASTDISEALNYLYNVQKKKCTTFILSDFLDEDYDISLKLCSKRHELIGIRVFDQIESSLPRVGILKLKNPEDGQARYVNTWSSKARMKYEQAFNKSIENVATVFKRSKSELITISTDDDYIKSLLRFFKKRVSR